MLQPVRQIREPSSTILRWLTLRHQQIEHSRCDECRGKKKSRLRGRYVKGFPEVRNCLRTIPAKVQKSVHANLRLINCCESPPLGGVQPA